MFTVKRQIGTAGAEDIARIRRLARGVMQVISSERPWRDPFKKITVYSAVDRCLTRLVLSGETDGEALEASALKAVRGTEWAIGPPHHPVRAC